MDEDEFDGQHLVHPILQRQDGPGRIRWRWDVDIVGGLDEPPYLQTMEFSIGENDESDEMD